MSAPLENAVRIEIEMPVHIPTPDGKAVAETVMVKVPALKDPATGEVYLTGEALEIMDKKKARPGTNATEVERSPGHRREDLHPLGDRPGTPLTVSESDAGSAVGRPVECDHPPGIATADFLLV
ncbi:MAG: hypothetical protein HYV35_01895 [Lentisphaerae bacterium]|nr:hypothetical protein [Lentisphaerota bacterium]